MTRLPASLVIVMVLLSVTLSGCFDYGGLHTPLDGLKPVPLWLNVDVVSLTVTKKTVYDHVASAMTGQNCSSPRVEMGDGAYCTNWPDPPAPPPEEYCYSTLARPTCYAQPYAQSNDHLVGYVPAAVTVR